MARCNDAANVDDAKEEEEEDGDCNCDCARRSRSFARERTPLPPTPPTPPTPAALLLSAIVERR